MDDPCDPESDFDGDGVCDTSDTCPDQPNPDQGRPLRLHPELPAGREVADYAVSPDGGWVVYRADREDDGRFELYAVQVEGGSTTKLNGPLIAGGSVSGFRISPDGENVVYRADQEVQGRPNLYAVTVSGGEPLRLADTTTGGVGSRFEITPDGGQVVYLLRHPGVPEGYSSCVPHVVPITGGAPVVLYPNGIESPADVTDFAVSPAGSHVVFILPSDIRLWSGTIDGSSMVRLDFSWDREEVARGPLRFLPDDSEVLYIGGSPCCWDDVVASALDGSEHRTEMSSGGFGNRILKYDVSNWPVDGGYRIVGIVDRDVGAGREFALVSVIAGPGNGLVLDDNYVRDFEITTDGTRIAYLASPRAVYVDSVLGGQRLRLSDPLLGNQSRISDIAIGPDSARLVYRADQDVEGEFELFGVALDGGPVVRLNGALPPGGSVSEAFLFDHAGATVMFVADRDVIGRRELFTVPATGGTALARAGVLSDEGSVIGDVTVTADDRYVLYRAPSGADLAPSLFRVPLETDSDADGVFDSCDCAPQDPGAWALPSAAAGLTLSRPTGGGTTVLSWNPPAFDGTDSLVYDLLRVDRANGFSANPGEEVECLVAGSTTTSATDTEIPAAAFFYVVRPRHACGVGLVGEDREAARNAACP